MSANHEYEYRKDGISPPDKLLKSRLFNYHLTRKSLDVKQTGPDTEPRINTYWRDVRMGYHMSGEVISALSHQGRYYNCHERAQGARDNYDIVTRVVQLISSSQSYDNLFITYLCLYQALLKEGPEGVKWELGFAHFLAGENGI